MSKNESNSRKLLLVNKTSTGFSGCSRFCLQEIEIKIAVANGLGNAKKLMADAVAGKSPYTFVEVMACPGGELPFISARKFRSLLCKARLRQWFLRFP